MNKQYLGDAVYVEFDGQFLILTTEDGVKKTNEIFLEDSVLNKLIIYLKQNLPIPHQQRLFRI